ncbi:MAG: hypothetical protein AAF696_25510, partial [Bacteroidota bacterium]
AMFSSLSKQELRYLKNFLNAFHSKGSNKALALIELLEKNPELSQAEAAEYLYGDPKSKAFIMLKARLTDKILETLSLGINLQNNEEFKEDPSAYAVIRILKQLSAALMLRKRGLGDLAQDIFEKCEKEADEAGLPEYRLPPLIYLQNIAASRLKGNWEYSDKISHSLEQYQTDIMGIGIFDEFNLMTRNHSYFSPENLSWLKEKIRLLENRLEQAYTLRSHYFFLNLLVSYYEGVKDYEQAKESLEELIDLLATHKGLQAKNRLGTPYIKLAAIECMILNFPGALKAAYKARELYHPKKFNFFSASLYTIFTHIYLGQIKEARIILGSLRDFRTQKSRIQSIELTYYLESCIHLLEGQPKEAYRILGKIQTVLSDKKGWNSSMRIYEIILMIEMENYDLASARIESLRKHLSKYKGEKRYADIFRALYLLEKNSFDFQKPKAELEELTYTLQVSKDWKAIGHEVIRFDVWLVAKYRKGNLLSALKKSFHYPSPNIHEVKN